MRELIQPAETVVRSGRELEDMTRVFLEYPVKYLYVVDAHQRFLGVVPLTALGTAPTRDADRHSRARERPAVAGQIEPITAGMTLGEALQHFLAHRGERLPVIESVAGRCCSAWSARARCSRPTCD